MSSLLHYCGVPRSLEYPTASQYTPCGSFWAYISQPDLSKMTCSKFSMAKLQQTHT